MQSVTVSIPARCADRPVFSGMVVPYVTRICADGKPDFKIIEPFTVLECATKRLCGICGTTMGSRIFFIGGEKSTAQGTYLDPPMHEPCARYAMAVCPFLIGSTDYSPVTTTRDGEPVGYIPGTVNERSSMSLTCFGGYEFVSGATVYFLANDRRWSEVFWQRELPAAANSAILDVGGKS